jgi:3',5'-cyclic-AMP phosphodiesterase
VCSYISATELAWLDEKLAEHESAGRVTYVMLHHPIADTVSGTASWQWAMQSEHSIDDMAAVKAVLSKYTDVVVFTGHSHEAVSYYQSATSGPLYVNTASVSYLVDDYLNEYEGSQGWYVYVLQDKVILRARDFTTGTWITSCVLSG